MQVQAQARRGGHSVAAALAALSVVGCAAGPKPLYHWDGYARSVYDQLLMPSQASGPRLLELESQAQKARAANAALPPGFRAHLGHQYLLAGRLDDARDAFRAEKAAFPESATYMDFLLRRMEPRRP